MELAENLRKVSELRTHSGGFCYGLSCISLSLVLILTFRSIEQGLIQREEVYRGNQVKVWPQSGLVPSEWRPYETRKFGELHASKEGSV